MNTPEEQAAFDDGKEYVIHLLQEWIKKTKTVSARILEAKLKRL